MHVHFQTGPAASCTASSQHFECVARAFEGEKHLLPATGAELEQSYVDGLAILGTNSVQDAIAFTRLIPLLPAGTQDQWYELGSTWIRSDCRGMKLNHRMYELFLPLHADKNILATTTNRASLAVGKDMGLVLVKRRKLPEAVWMATCMCPVSKTGCERKNIGCLLAHGEPQHTEKDSCWLRVTRETLARMRV